MSVKKKLLSVIVAGILSVQLYREWNQVKTIMSEVEWITKLDEERLNLFSRLTES